MPTIVLDLAGYLATFAPAGTPPDGRCAVPDGATIADLARGLGVGGYHLGLALVNDEPAGAARVLQEGDRVRFVPLVGGG